MARQVAVLVGTTKGAFLYHSDEARREWRLTGPHLAGWEVHSFLGDPGGGERLFAGTSHFSYGATIRVSDDRGESWEQVAAGPAYSPESGRKLKRIWQLAAGHPSEPDTLYAGVDEAGLFVSRDRGATWKEVTALSNHPTREFWYPGMGGLCLHTILPDPRDPRRLLVAISAVGVFRSDDGGASWVTRNEGLPRVPTGAPGPEVGRCVHKMVRDPRAPDTLYQQYHGGVFRSTDGAATWQAIERGLPSNFGFPMVITGAAELFVIPLDSDVKRYTKDGQLRVYRSRDRGERWEGASRGLPDEPTYVGVLRDALATDGLEPAGLYFGTTMGDVYASTDAGESWHQLPGKFSRISCVKTWVRDG